MITKNELKKDGLYVGHNTLNSLNITKKPNLGNQTLKNPTNKFVPTRTIASLPSSSTGVPSKGVKIDADHNSINNSQHKNSNANTSQSNISFLSNTTFSNVQSSNQGVQGNKVEEVVSLNRRPKQVLRFRNPAQGKALPQARKRLIDAYNKGEFREDELYVRNKHMGYVKIDDFVEDEFMLVEAIDKKTGRNSWKIVRAKDLLAYSEINTKAKEFFAGRNNAFPRYIKKSKKLGKEEFSNFKGQGYKIEFISGLDDANMLVALTKKIKKAHPTKTHIADLEQFINRHLEFIRRGSKAHPEHLRNLDREARQRIKSRKLTYLWWLDWNYRLAQVASRKNLHTVTHLSSVNFPDTVLLPTIYQIGIIGKNRTYVNDIHMVKLVNNKDKKGRLPSEIFEQDMASGHFTNKDRKLMNAYIKRNFKEFSVAERQAIEEQYFHKFYSKSQRKVAQNKK